MFAKTKHTHARTKQLIAIKMVFKKKLMLIEWKRSDAKHMEMPHALNEWMS